jgi:hypothetical protein
MQEDFDSSLTALKRTIDGIEYDVIENRVDETVRKRLEAGKVEALQIVALPPGAHSLDLIPAAARPRLKALILTDWFATDLSVLAELTALESLDLWASPARAVQLPVTLRRCAIQYSKQVDDVFALPLLQELMMAKPPKDVFKRLKDMSLRHFEFTEGGKFEKFEVPELSLESLKMVLAKFDSLDALRNIKQLRSLVMDTCKIADESLEFIAALPKLRELDLDQCGTIASLDPVRRSDVRKLFIGDKTKVRELGPEVVQWAQTLDEFWPPANEWNRLRLKR